MASTWVLIADNTRARLFLASNRLSPLQEINTLVHPEARLHEQELTSDLPGRSYKGDGSGRHGMADTTEPKRQEAINFAREISNHLEEARKKGELKQLIIIAAPMLLGLLREQLSNTTRKLITMELDKNITQLKPDEIRRHLPDRLPIL